MAKAPSNSPAADNTAQAQRLGSFPILGKDDFARIWARRSYIRYCTLVHRGLWSAGVPHELVTSKLDDVACGKIKRLMIWMPPQHGKSMMITETFPSYYLGKNPDSRAMIGSYNDNFAQKFGRKNRDKIAEFGEEIFGISLSKEKNSAASWDIAGHAGGMISVGIGGAATGEGAHLLIIDDPIKNREEANSKTMRDKVHEEYRSTFKTRVRPGGAIIIVMTRWHEDDLCGRLLNPEYGEPDDWEIIRLPAEAEVDDLLGRAEGDSLWPEGGFTSEWLAQQKAAVGSYAYAGLYQQRPSPAEGGIIRRSWFKFYKQPPSTIGTQAQSWDCTFKDGDNNDFVAGHVWGKQGADFFLLDRVHGRMGITETMQAIRTLSAKHPKARAKYVEDAANGPAVIELLKKKVPGLIPVRPEGGKIVRAQAVSPYIEAGNVYLPDPSIAPWVHDFIEECANFPNGAHDDDVDAMSQAIIQLADKQAHSVPPADYGADKQSYWRG
jgi:predicted phage terminase large subunit-like protein